MTKPPSVAVVTDSTHYLPREMGTGAAIEQVSLYVGSAGELDRETDIADLDAFYARLRDGADIPTTSQPSVGDFLDCYEPLVASGRDVVSIHLAGGLSGTLAAAVEAAGILAASGHRGRVEVIDSASGAAGLGLLVLAAAACARDGADADAVVERVRCARESLGMWFCLDTLEYLRRGGRIGGAQAWLGSALKIKPILTFGNEITPVERVRTSRRAFDRLVAYLRELRDADATIWAVQHIQAADSAQRLVAEGTAILGCPPSFCSEVGPVLGAHLGPGMLGVAGISAA